MFAGSGGDQQSSPARPCARARGAAARRTRLVEGRHRSDGLPSRRGGRVGVGARRDRHVGEGHRLVRPVASVRLPGPNTTTGMPSVAIEEAGVGGGRGADRARRAARPASAAGAGERLRAAGGRRASRTAASPLSTCDVDRAAAGSIGAARARAPDRRAPSRHPRRAASAGRSGSAVGRDGRHQQAASITPTPVRGGVSTGARALQLAVEPRTRSTTSAPAGWRSRPGRGCRHGRRRRRP